MSEVNVFEIDGRINALERQRNNALSEAVLAQGIVAVHLQTIQTQAAKIESLEAEIAALREPEINTGG